MEKEMHSEAPACPVCGGSKYYKECGFYYCLECQTQSQELREELHEFTATGYSNAPAVRVSGGKTTQKKKKKDELKELTTWEYSNFLLKGMVDDLINLGATKKLKVIVLQLWASYLKKIDVAFTAKKNVGRLPKLGVKFHHRDAKLIYGYHKERLRKRKNKGSRTSSGISVTSASVSGMSSSSNRLERLTLFRSKKALATAEYNLKYSSAGSQMDSSMLDSSVRYSDMSSSGGSDSETTTKSSRIQYSRVALQQKHDPKSAKFKNSDQNRNVFLTHSLSRIKLLAFLYLGLRILHEEIQLSDMLRWIEEGELSYYEVTHFYPDDIKFKGDDFKSLGVFLTRPSDVSVNVQAMELAKFLEIKYLPTPDLAFLVRRYTEELQLPGEIMKYVECLMDISPPSPVMNLGSTQHLPNYEARAVAFVIFILKLLLGLDGETEYKISEACKKLNRLQISDGTGKHFVWDDWVKYIECRKAVIASFHFPAQLALNEGDFSDPNNFIAFWEKNKTKDDKRKERVINVTGMNPHFKQAMKYCFTKLAESEADNSKTINFIPSLTPQITNLKMIKAVHPSIFEPQAEVPSSACILNEDFTATTLNILVDPEPYIAVAREKNVKLKVVKETAQTKSKKVNMAKKEYVNLRKQRTFVIERKGKSVPKRVQSTSSESSNEDSSLDSDDNFEESCGFSVNTSDMVETVLRGDLQADNISADKSEPLFRSSKKYSNLPVIAKHMLVEKLKSNNIPLSSQFVGIEDASSKSAAIGKPRRKRRTKVTINLPYNNYWLNELSSRNYSNYDFERYVACDFPPSFNWLLTECSQMLQTTKKSLYTELLNVEMMHCYLFAPGGRESLTGDLKRIVSDVEVCW